MAGDRRRHAQPRIGVDIGRADEALHQLVGDVVVLGEQLAREIERDRVRPVALDDALEAVRRRGRAPCPSRRARACRRAGAASDAAAACRGRASRRAPRPSSRACRSSPGAPDRPRSSRRLRRPASRACRSPTPQYGQVVRTLGIGAWTFMRRALLPCWRGSRGRCRFAQRSPRGSRTRRSARSARALSHKRRTADRAPR